ncbi:tight adherence protein C [Alkalibacillus filiformis]|uniref:Tight adherence protein C n=1 Tax=Alkalibacillus filiformis TaxID=200990 RepID=A0ABU0DQQ8_9BACI|nr:type II secretion system F family protein [Alkalibacillus filiformis]MDQ0350776.1 tight adherence protein C [Alkalibacillus filiformis]
MTQFIFFISTFVFLTLVVAGILHFFMKREINIEQRADQLTSRSSDQLDDEGEGKRQLANSQFVQKGITQARTVMKDKMSGHSIKTLEQKLRESGNPKNLSAVDFRLIQFTVGIGLFLVVFLLLFPSSESLSQVLLISGAAGLIGFIYPMANLNTRRKNRLKEIEKMMPDYFDMLNLSVEAGMGLDSAMVQSCEKVKGPLSDEFQVALEDMKLGNSRDIALSDLRDRVPSDQFQNVIRSLVQADRLGVGMSKVIRVQTERIREQQLQRAREQAMKTPVKMLLPMVFCIFPLLFIVLMGPIAIQIFDTLF